ncbi:hypothetical protein [Nocardiopsis synnemataformans]|uniref:hypothetical protein n=1 Tax=Nocardiopsis synnemataformans TaxID=61305 RepID=UPI003EBA90CE
MPEGVEVVGSDITDPKAVSSAAEGTAGAYLLWPGYGTEGIEETVAALTGHVRRVVYFSAVAAGEDADSVWGRAESAVRASGTVTGPESLTQAEQVRILGEETGLPVRWDEQPEEEARAELTETMGADFATAGLAYWVSLVEAPEPASGDVEAVTGRPALTFRAWARERAGDFTAGAST